jgi:hypothetical protein
MAMKQEAVKAMKRNAGAGMSVNEISRVREGNRYPEAMRCEALEMYEARCRNTGRRPQWRNMFASC